MHSTRSRTLVRAPFALLAFPLFLVACGGSTSPGGITAPAGGGPSPSASQEVNPGGDIPDTQAYVAYAFPSGSFTVTVPEGWARTETNGVVTFTSHYNSITLQTVSAGSAPTTASALALEVPVIRRQASGVVMGMVSSTVRTAGPVILITYQAHSPADPVTGRFAVVAVERYEFWRKGVETIITLAAPVGADNVDPWRTITNSFTWR
ncbi:MAG: hypothetical protein ACHQ4F_10210 [Candidatus Dormibacteria bacterium]